MVRVAWWLACRVIVLAHVSKDFRPWHIIEALGSLAHLDLNLMRVTFENRSLALLVIWPLLIALAIDFTRVDWCAGLLFHFAGVWQTRVRLLRGSVWSCHGSYCWSFRLDLVTALSALSSTSLFLLCWAGLCDLVVYCLGFWRLNLSWLDESATRVNSTIAWVNILDRKIPWRLLRWHDLGLRIFKAIVQTNSRIHDCRICLVIILLSWHVP